MEKRTILITGAAGEIGHCLSEELSARGDCTVVLLDRRAATEHSSLPHTTWVSCDILDRASLELLFGRYEFTDIIHLAAILSSGGERDPLAAHRTNVDGSLYLLELARQQSERREKQGGTRTRFLFPSSIAAYGLPNVATKYQAGAVQESQYLDPITMYGANKLYVEHLGRYYSAYYGSLTRVERGLLDFRSVRFPGLLSADTVPTGGTSDFGPEMIHAAAQEKPYHCFVSPETVIPFMAMPDAIRCILMLLDAPAETLTQRVYNVTSFSISAAEIRARVLRAFPRARIEFVVDQVRHRIVESWPAAMDDSAARRDWQWAPRLSLDQTFDSYLIPRISARYLGHQPLPTPTRSGAEASAL